MSSGKMKKFSLIAVALFERPPSMAIGASHIAFLYFGDDARTLADKARGRRHVETLFLRIAMIEVENNRVGFPATDARMRFFPRPNKGAKFSALSQLRGVIPGLCSPGLLGSISGTPATAFVTGVFRSSPRLHTG